MGRSSTARRRRRRRRGGDARRKTLIVLAIVIAAGVAGTIAFEDRHWHAFDDAGDGAFERGNLDYAERMYQQALDVARELDEDELIAATLQDLARTYRRQGRTAEARTALQEAARH